VVPISGCCYVFYGVPRQSIGRIQGVLARNVRLLREQAGWTQEQAADAANIAARHYQKIEAGTVNLTLATLARLANGFKVEVKRLFEERGA